MASEKWWATWRKHEAESCPKNVSVLEGEGYGTNAIVRGPHQWTIMTNVPTYKGKALVICQFCLDTKTVDY